MKPKENTRRLAVIAAVFCMLATSGIAAGGNGNAGGHSKSTCNAGRGNGSEADFSGVGADGLPNDCDPGNSGPHNHGGDSAFVVP
jgi:hypothetical protein